MYEGTLGVVTGWGTLKEDGKPSCSLQEVELPVMSNAKCKMTKYSSSMISENMMCAGYPETGKKDSCQVNIFFINQFIYVYVTFIKCFYISG